MIEAGANVKEAMPLAEHSTPDLTLNTYSKTRSNQLRALTEKVAEVVGGGGGRSQTTIAFARGSIPDSSAKR